jgi:hypothetical protein
LFLGLNESQEVSKEPFDAFTLDQKLITSPVHTPKKAVSFKDSNKQNVGFSGMASKLQNPVNTANT